MFNLLVSAYSEAWEDLEKSGGQMSAERFKEYSGTEADGVTLSSPPTLQVLEGLPTLLFYESETRGPNAQIVRFGTIRNIEASSYRVQFRFDLDPKHGFIARSHLQRFSDELSMHSFEHHRTHWAVKDGEVPTELIAHGTPTPPVRDVRTVAADYAEAVIRGNRSAAKVFADEFAKFPSSIGKTVAWIDASLDSHFAPELLRHLGVIRRSDRARVLVTKWVSADASPFSRALLLDQFGGPLDDEALREALDHCSSAIVTLLGSTGTAAARAEALWRAARSPAASRRLRPQLNRLVEKLAGDQVDGVWKDGKGVRDWRTTALATVSLQRLGSDKHRALTKSGVIALARVWSEGIQLPRTESESQPDTAAIVFTLEAIRRSSFSSDLRHIVDAGERALYELQTSHGLWRAADWTDPQVTAAVVDYFSSANSMLAQVDGFFLMARDFFRKAEELAQEGGANDRRLAAIATVHAMEMFLYGLFERRPDLGLSAYRDNGVETLGPREALSSLQTALQSAGLLSKPKRLSHRDQLSSLVGLRDGIIHRAQEMSAEELMKGMHAVKSFIDEYGAQLITLDLLQ